MNRNVVMVESTDLGEIIENLNNIDISTAQVMNEVDNLLNKEKIEREYYSVEQLLDMADNQSTSIVGKILADNSMLRELDINAQDFTDYCTNCGNKGLTVDEKEHCDVCGRDYVKPVTPTENDYPPNLYIPRAYKGKVWSKEDFEKNPNVRYLPEANKKLYSSWLGGLDDLLCTVKENITLPNRIVVTSPEDYGRELWTYTFMKELHRNKVKVSNITNIAKIDVNNFKLFTDTVLVILVTKYDFYNNIDKLDYILQERNYRDKITLVVSSIPYSKFISNVDNLRLKFDLELSLNNNDI